MVALSLLGLLLALALQTIYVEHRYRTVLTAVEKSKQQTKAEALIWSQLLLEKSSLTALLELEGFAKTHLQMRIPQTHEIIYLAADVTHAPLS